MNVLSDREAFSKIGLFTPNDIRRMLDVEYVSELTIAMLNGLQNKKINLRRTTKFMKMRILMLLI